MLLCSAKLSLSAARSVYWLWFTASLSPTLAFSSSSLWRVWLAGGSPIEDRGRVDQVLQAVHDHSLVQQAMVSQKSILCSLLSQKVLFVIAAISLEILESLLEKHDVLAGST
jgi:hypothetical protein